MENDMKQFNLQEYLAHPERKVVTRDGRPVRIICTDFDNPDFPVIGEINGNKWPLSFATNGEAIKGRPLACDLFFAPEKHKGWVNVYYRGSYKLGSNVIYRTEDEAIAASEDVRNYIKTIKIEWEE